jgi:hypothetical protein
MGIRVSEYLGVRVDSKNSIIPISANLGNDSEKIRCPFRNDKCDKVKRKQHPVCSVKDTRDNTLWLVCSHRLCSTQPKNAPLNEHQKKILMDVAKYIYYPEINKSDVLVKREVQIPITNKSDYYADYVMYIRNPRKISPTISDCAVVLEMQGGGETSNTGKLSKHIKEWAESDEPSNTFLSQDVNNVSPLVTNAWRRQQEQFLVKGNVAMMSGGRMVFCVGTMLYDYLFERIRTGILMDLRGANWTLAVIAFKEDTIGVPPACAPCSIPLTIDETRTKFTNYSAFVQALTNQGKPCDAMFKGAYTSLVGDKVLF